MVLGIAGRHETARSEILAAAWELAAEHGLTGFSLSDLASRVGVKAPSLYSYFASKRAIYDAMFAEGNRAFAERLATVDRSAPPRQALRQAARLHVAFCAEQPVRYQLLFQRAIPGFEPSAESYALAEGALADLRRSFAEIGITDARQVDLWTAIVSGLAAQQVANDPAGDRWLQLAEEAADMFFDHTALADSAVNDSGVDDQD